MMIFFKIIYLRSTPLNVRSIDLMPDVSDRKQTIGEQNHELKFLVEVMLMSKEIWEYFLINLFPSPELPSLLKNNENKEQKKY